MLFQSATLHLYWYASERGMKTRQKEPKKSTKWNNILIRLEHAHRSLTTRTPLKTPFNRHESSSKSLSTSRNSRFQNGNKRWWFIVGQIVGCSTVGTQFGQTKNVQWRCLPAELESESPLSNHSFSCKNVKKSISTTQWSHNYIRSIWHFEVMKCIRTIMNITRHTFDMFFRFLAVYTLVIHYFKCPKFRNAVGYIRNDVRFGETGWFRLGHSSKFTGKIRPCIPSQGYIRIKCRKTVFIIEINIVSCCDDWLTHRARYQVRTRKARPGFFILISRFVAYITLDNSDYFSSFGVRFWWV